MSVRAHLYVRPGAGGRGYSASYYGDDSHIWDRALTRLAVPVAVVLTLVIVTAGTAGPVQAQEEHYRRSSGSPMAYERGVRTPIPADAVRLEVGSDFQAAVDTHQPGTTFAIASGTHREQRVVPKEGMRFIGEDGAVMSGTRVLPATAFERDGEHWAVGGRPRRESSAARPTRASTRTRGPRIRGWDRPGTPRSSTAPISAQVAGTSTTPPTGSTHQRPAVPRSLTDEGTRVADAGKHDPTPDRRHDVGSGRQPRHHAVPQHVQGVDVGVGDDVAIGAREHRPAQRPLLRDLPVQGRCAAGHLYHVDGQAGPLGQDRKGAADPVARQRPRDGDELAEPGRQPIC